MMKVGYRPRRMICLRIPEYRLAILFFCLVWLGGLPALGQKSYLSEELRVEGNRFFDTETLLAETGLHPGLPFDLQRLEGGIERMLSLYEDNGFPYCEISPGDFRVSEDGRVSLSLLVEEGPQVRITEIQPEGLRSTKKEVILREMGKDLCGPFSQSRLEASLKRVERLSFIEKIEDVQLLAGEDPEKGILKVRLRERTNNSVEGMMGYAPGAGNRRGNLFGSLDLSFDNIFGTGRMMHWNWSRRDRHSSYLLFSYREPWVLGFPPTLQLDLEQVDRDSTYLKLSASAKITFDVTRRLSWGLEMGWEKVLPGPAGGSQIPDSRGYLAGVSLSFDLLNRPENPREGVLYRTKVILTRKRNHKTAFLAPERERASSVRLALDLEHFLPTLRMQTLFMGVHLRELFTNQGPVPLSDQFEMGGAGSLRGYREGEFLGTTVAWANLEYRLLLQDNSRIHFFVDYGHYGRVAKIGKNHSLLQISGEKLGYGVGLRVDSRAGLLGADYGLGQGDNINQGKLHFRLINRF